VTRTSAATQVAAVIGSPVRHSLSPTLHNAAFAAADLDWTFVAFEVAPGDGGSAVSAMRTFGIRGLAVTMPHKEAVAAAVDEVDPAAGALRSVNTVVLRPDGTTFGASTDGAGFVDSLAAASVDVRGGSVAVIGAGAAARSVIDALARAGAADIAVLNRSAERAESAAGLTAVARVGQHRDVSAADVVVNATSVGMGTDDVVIDASLLRAGQVVADLVYHPVDTALLRAARAAGARVVDGLGMLVHQAARQQELWTGRAGDPVVMRGAAEAELDRRHR
jgi:shikimate dehydrogenase